MSDADIDATKAPLMDHLIELRTRLIKALIAFFVTMILCFVFAKYIYNILLFPYELAAGSGVVVKLIYTAPQEFLITQIKLALFGAAFLSFPVVATQIYMFVAPGLYKHERGAFLPYLIATPICFLLGALFVYFVAMPLAMRFFLGMQQLGGEGQAEISLLPKVSEYLSLIMGLIFAFGICFQMPVILTLARAHRLHHRPMAARQAPLRHRGRVHHRGGADAARRDQPAGARVPDAALVRGVHLPRGHGREEESRGGRGQGRPRAGSAAGRTGKQAGGMSRTPRAAI